MDIKLKRKTFHWVLVREFLRLGLPPDHQSEVVDLQLADLGVSERDGGAPDALDLAGGQLVLAETLTQILELEPANEIAIVPDRAAGNDCQNRRTCDPSTRS